MKNMIKTALVAIVAITFASCSGSSSGTGSDSSAVKDGTNTTITSGDTSMNVDSMRADSNAMQADTSTNKPE